MLIGDKMLITNKADDIDNDNKLIKKYEKLSKTRKLLKSLKLSKLKNLKGKKLSKSQKLAKSEKKLSKIGNLLSFDIKKNRPSFLTPNAKMSFNYL